MGRSRRRRALAARSLVLDLAAAGLGATAQDPQAPTRQVFRAGANFVAVDAYPTRDGKIVDSLTRDDFEVFEDGKRQSIEQFEFVRGVPDGPDAEPRPTRLEAAERLAGDARRRVFVVYLTGYHASREGAANTQKATTAFFNQSVSPSDLFGVLRLYDDVRDLVLGDRPDVLVDEANGYWDWASLPHPKGWPRLRGRRAGLQLHHEHEGQDARRRRADRGSVAREAHPRVARRARRPAGGHARSPLEHPRVHRGASAADEHCTGNGRAVRVARARYFQDPNRIPNARTRCAASRGRPCRRRSTTSWRPRHAATSRSRSSSRPGLRSSTMTSRSRSRGQKR